MSSVRQGIDSLYFDDPHDLKRQMDKLTELGIYIQDE